MSDIDTLRKRALALQLQAAAKIKAQLSAAPSPKLKLGGIHENLIGKGAIDTPGEILGDTIKSGFAGAARGIEGLLSLPETAGSLAKRGVQYARGQEVQPMPDQTVLGGLFDSGVRAVTGMGGDPNVMDYLSDNRLGQAVGTIGEFVGGAGAATKLTKPITGAAVASGAGSEAAGQATEGTDIEPFARIAGALTAPYAGSKALQAFNRQSTRRPTVQALRREKNEAYRLVSQAGEGFDEADVNSLINSTRVEARSSGYYPDTDANTTKALGLVEGLLDTARNGGTVFLDDVDKVRRRLNKLYKQTNDEVAILSIMRSLDDAVASKAGNSNLVTSARSANSRYSKALLLDTEFKKDVLQTASTGSGGNILNKYKQTLTSIMSDERKARFFTPDELSAMDAIVMGNVGSNALRLIGKLSPSGNGLMAGLNIVAAVQNPAFLLGTAVAGSAKKISDRQVSKAVERLQDLVSAGGIRQSNTAQLRAVAREILTPGYIAPRSAGLMAQRPEDEETN